MHARELAVLASWLAFNSDSLMHSLESKSSIAAQQYWTSFKCRMQRWMNDLRHFEMDARNLEPEHNPWPAAKVVVEEILLSEILTRIWAAMMSSREKYHGAEEMEAVARNVHASQVEARNRALRLMVAPHQCELESPMEINGLRVHLERWTDLLLAQLPNSEMAVRFAFDVRRMTDFTEEQSSLTKEEIRQNARGYSRIFSDDLLNWTSRFAANPSLNREIAVGIIACLEADRFEFLGLPDATYGLWIEKQGADTQSLVDQLVRLEVEAGDCLLNTENSSQAQSRIARINPQK